MPSYITLCESDNDIFLAHKYIIFLLISYHTLVCGLWLLTSGFGGAEVACWPLIPKFAGSSPAEAVGFLKGDKNRQHLRKGSKIIGPMSQICDM